MTLLDSRPTSGATAPRRHRDLVVAAVAAVALVVAGVALWQVNHPEPTPPSGGLAPQPTRQLIPTELVGLWQATPDSSWLWEFSADGRLLITVGVDGYLRGAGDVRGSDGAETVTIERTGNTYAMNDAQASTTGVDGSSGCSGSRIEFVAAETISLVDDCGGAGSELRLERVSPRDPTAPALRPRFAQGVARPVTAVGQLEGSWVNAETHRVLAVGPPSDGAALTYVLDDDGDGSVRPDQRGTLTVGAGGSVRPRPGSNTAGGCAPTFSKVVTTGATLVTTSTGNSCFPVGSTQTWLRLN